MTFELRDTLLSNNVRVITEQNTAFRSMSLGLFVDVGSRDEGDGLWGCSHFLEHLLFKGTETKSSKEISSIIENRGGYLNAFTDHDMTGYYARILGKDQDTAIELLSDILENSLLRKEDIEIERQVILEEIKQTLDDPSSLIHELYAQNIWRNSSLAHPISGTFETISNMQVGKIIDFYKENYRNNLLVVAAGAVDHEKLISSIEKYVKKGRGKCVKDRKRPEFYPSKKCIERDLGQVQLCISAPGYPYGSRKSTVQSIISSYLGLGASSKLFQEVREKRGLVYNIYTHNQNLEDFGVFNVFAGTSKEKLIEVIENIVHEFEYLKQGIDTKELEIVKHKTIGLYILNSERNMHRMHHLGTSTLRTGKPESMEDVVSRLGSVTNEELQRVATEMFKGNKIAITALGITENEVKDLDNLLE